MTNNATDQRMEAHINRTLGGPLMRTIRYNWDSEDQWSATMEWWFAIAATMYRESYDIPADWEYRPGHSVRRDEGPDEDDCGYAESDLWDSLSAGYITEDDLRRTGNVLLRYAAQLKLAGLDY